MKRQFDPLNQVMPLIDPLYDHWNDNTDPIYQHYNDNTDNAGSNVYGQYWSTQTFTVEVTHEIKKVCFKAFHYGIVPRIGTVAIQGIRLGLVPDGVNLTWVNFSTHLFKRSEPAEWQCIDIPAYELTAGVKYAIVISVPGAGVGDRLVVRYNSAGTYVIGNACTSTNGGVGWYNKPLWDYQFEEWGDPPAPPPPVGPPTKWACLSLTEICLADGYTFTAATSKPIHLWLRLTDQPYRKHMKSEVVRGETKMTDLRFCFTQFTDIEQEEAGDTLEHTFIVRNWLQLPFSEQWGSTLQQNNPWSLYAPPDVPETLFANGTLKLTNPGLADCGITCAPSQGLLPLIKENTAHLFANVSNPSATADSTSSQLHHELIFRNGDNWFTLYLCLAHGAEFEDERFGYIAGRPFGWTTIGSGTHTIDLVELFIYFRDLLGLSNNPTGWQLLVIAYAMGTQSPACHDYLVSNYLTFTHGIPPDNTVYPKGVGETRYFYLLGTENDVPSPSTSNTFEYHFPPLPYRNQLVGTPTNSDRVYSNQGLYAIFYPPMDVNCERLAACLSKESVDDPPVYPDQLFMEVRTAPDLDECGVLLKSVYVNQWMIPVAPTFKWFAGNFPRIVLQKGQPYAFVIRSSEPFGATKWGKAARLLTTECIMSPTVTDSFVAANPCQVAVGSLSPLFLVSPRSVGIPSGTFVA